MIKLPKEYALELCKKFMISNSYQAIVWYNARICALIAVEEMLLEHFGDDSEYGTRRYYYLIEVEKEIALIVR